MWTCTMMSLGNFLYGVLNEDLMGSRDSGILMAILFYWGFRALQNERILIGSQGS